MDLHDLRHFTTSGPSLPITGSEAGTGSERMRASHRARRRFPADVPSLAAGVSADHEEVVAGLEQTMACSGRQDDDVPGVDVHFHAAGSAEHEPRHSGHAKPSVSWAVEW